MLATWVKTLYRVILAKNNNFARASRFFVLFLAVVARLQRESHANFTFSRGREHMTATFFFFSWTLTWQPLRTNSKKKIARIWRIKRDGIIVIKSEAARIHFLSDVFVSVAVVVAYLWLVNPLTETASFLNGSTEWYLRLRQPEPV